MLPSVTILVCTYARSAFVQEALECFARQEYDGKLDMVIVNDCPLQTLETIVPGVKVVNLDKPCASYADKRNLALSHADGELCCMWDDDDIYLPTFVATVVGKMRSGDKAARLSRLMRWDGRFASVISGAQYHTAVFNVEALRKLGGWRDVPITDADFARRLVQYRFFHGKHLNEDDGRDPLMIYRNDQARVHMEGGGHQRLTREQFMDTMNRRIYSKKEPGGVVTLKAGWTEDWTAFVPAHLPKPNPSAEA